MKMRNLIVASMLALSMVVTALAQEKPGNGSANGAPKLVITTFNHDFGEVKPGTPLKHSFIVKNQGKGDLEITSVTPGCGCTASNFDALIAPGKEGKITLEIARTELYSGEVAKSAQVVTNDPLSQSFNLMLRAYFTPGSAPPAGASSPPSPIAIAGAGKMIGPFAVSPGDRWVTSVLTGSSSTGTLNLYNGSGTPVRVKRVSPGGTDFTVNFLTIEEGKRYELSVATNPALKPGQYHQTVKLLTDSKGAPEMEIELAATVYPKVFVTPTSMNFAQLSATADGATSNVPPIYVRKLRGGGLKVNSVTSTLPFINVSVTAEAEGQIYTIRVTIDKSKLTTPGEFKGKIRIETNDTDTPVLEVPVQGSVS
jgi:hypothetical protein